MILYLSVPHDGYYRPEITQFRDATSAWLKSRGDTLIWDPVRDRPTMACRNNQIRRFLETPATVFLTMDWDCNPFRNGIPDIDGLSWMLDSMKKPEIDVVYGWTLIYTGEHMVPCVMKQTVGRGVWPLDFAMPYEKEPLHDLQGGAVGSHCFMAKRKVFLGMIAPGKLWFDDVHERDPESPKYGGRIQGHDVSFCRQAQDRGFRLWLDNRILWGHMKEVDLRWVHDLVRELTRRIDAHQTVALDFDPDTAAWVTLRRAEEHDKGSAVCVYRGQYQPPGRDNSPIPGWRGSRDPEDEPLTLIFELVDAPAWKAWQENPILHQRVEYVEDGAVVTL